MNQLNTDALQDTTSAALMRINAALKEVKLAKATIVRPKAVEAEHLHARNNPTQAMVDVWVSDYEEKHDGSSFNRYDWNNYRFLVEKEEFLLTRKSRLLELKGSVDQVVKKSFMDKVCEVFT